jgi:AraC family transcriptional regulator
MARQAFVPITLGASGSASLALDGFLVTDAGFPPLTRLAPHVHERATLAVMLEGSFDLSITNRVYPCEPGCVVTEPAEERHGNALGNAGAHVLVVQPDPTALDRLGPCGRMFEDVRYAARGSVSGVAWRIVRELRSPDSATPLEVEGLVLEMLALASRQGQGERRARQAPPWLARTRELLHASFRRPPPIDELAREAGVHPDYLARAFRVRFGVPVGTYVRRLRLEWAAARLAGTEEPIAQIALDAGFADQSHFTRAFKRYAGLTPGEYRSGPALRSLTP